jgi:hypothetical protein
MVDTELCVRSPYIIINVFKVMFDIINVNVMHQCKGTFREMIGKLAWVNFYYGMTFENCVDPNEKVTTMNKKVMDAAEFPRSKN